MWSFFKIFKFIYKIFDFISLKISDFLLFVNESKFFQITPHFFTDSLLHLSY
jgi:hypothetical protein